MPAGMLALPGGPELAGLPAAAAPGACTGRWAAEEQHASAEQRAKDTDEQRATAR